MPHCRHPTTGNGLVFCLRNHGCGFGLQWTWTVVVSATACTKTDNMYTKACVPYCPITKTIVVVILTSSNNNTAAHIIRQQQGQEQHARKMRIMNRSNSINKSINTGVADSTSSRKVTVKSNISDSNNLNNNNNSATTTVPTESSIVEQLKDADPVCMREALAHIKVNCWLYPRMLLASRTVMSPSFSLNSKEIQIYRCLAGQQHPWVQPNSSNLWLSPTLPSYHGFCGRRRPRF